MLVVLSISVALLDSLHLIKIWIFGQQVGLSPNYYSVQFISSAPPSQIRFCSKSSSVQSGRKIPRQPRFARLRSGFCEVGKSEISLLLFVIFMWRDCARLATGFSASILILKISAFKPFATPVSVPRSQ